MSSTSLDLIVVFGKADKYVVEKLADAPISQDNMLTAPPPPPEIGSARKNLILVFSSQTPCSGTNGHFFVLDTAAPYSLLLIYKTFGINPFPFSK